MIFTHSFRPQEVILGMNSGIEKCSHTFQKNSGISDNHDKSVSGVKIEHI